MEILKKNLDGIRNLVLKKDMDWLIVVEGMEGVGKTTLALKMCRYFDPKFNIKKVCFNLEQFKDAVRTSKFGDAINIDEGALMCFTRDAMKGEVKEFIRLMTAIRQYRLLIVICIPDFYLLDKYIREWRIKSLIKVKSRGRFFFFSKNRIKQIRMNKRKTKRIYPTPDFKESFSSMKDEFWDKYLDKKGSILDNEDDNLLSVTQFAKKMKKSRVTIHNWINNGEIEFVKKGLQYYIPRTEIQKLTI